MHTTVFFNLKGGTGKTVSCINFAAELAARGKLVVCVDADPQMNLTHFFDKAGDAEVSTLHDVLTQGVPSWLANLIRPTRLAGVAILPASMDLILDDVRAIHEQRIRITAIRELVELLAEEDAADYVLIDSPPGFTAATTCALAAADDVIIPMRPDAFSVAGVGELMRQVRGMREINPRLHVAGVLVTQLRHTTVAKETVDALAESAIPMFSATIRSATAIERSTFERKPVRDLTGLYAKQAAEDYAAAVDEWLKGGAGNGNQIA